MKKLITLLLAAVMLLSMTACGGSAEPVETAPATTEPVAQVTEEPTEAPTEEPTEAPTEPRVAPVDFEAVDPATLPEPIPVEEQLQSEDTQTVTLGSLEEYEDLLWSLGFEEVRLAGTHDAGTVDNFGTDVTASCEPVSLTYNDRAFRFDFTYCMTNSEGEIAKEDGWYMYGTKSTALANISPITDKDFYKQETHVHSVGYTQEEFMELLAGGADLSALLSGENQVQSSTADYEEEFMGFVLRSDETRWVNMKAVYYTITGNLYNYMRDLNSEGAETQLHGASPELEYKGEQAMITIVGFAARTMCFHYLFPAEDAAE